EGLVAPAELPSDMNSFKSQQYRWAKGSVQTARKLLPRLLRGRLPLATKIEACFHLSANAAYLFALVPAVLMLPLLWLPDRGQGSRLAFFAALFLLSTGAFLSFFVATLARQRQGSRWRWLHLPGLMMVGIGLSLNNGR